MVLEKITKQLTKVLARESKGKMILLRFEKTGEDSKNFHFKLNIYRQKSKIKHE